MDRYGLAKVSNPQFPESVGRKYTVTLFGCFFLNAVRV